MFMRYEESFCCPLVDSHIGDPEAKTIAGALEGKDYKEISLDCIFMLQLVCL